MASAARTMPVEHREEQVETLSRSRLRVPQKNLVGRPRLLSLFERAGNFRVALLQAPAGYGKTSFMQQWADRSSAEGADIVWLSVDSRDCDPMFFARHLERAIDESGALPPGTVSAEARPAYYG